MSESIDITIKALLNEINLHNSEVSLLKKSNPQRNEKFSLLDNTQMNYELLDKNTRKLIGKIIRNDINTAKSEELDEILINNYKFSLSSINFTKKIGKLRKLFLKFLVEKSIINPNIEDFIDFLKKSPI